MATSSPTPRRIYLTERLVRKQITMEEATELFTLMSRDIDRLRKAVMAAGGAGVPPAPGAPPPPPPPGWSSRTAALDNLDELLLFGGPLLGVLAALMKRSGMDLLGSPGPTSGPKGPKGGPGRAEHPPS